MTTGDESHIANTIIDGNSASAVIQIPSNAESGIVITGITIQNGSKGVVPFQKFDFLNNIVTNTVDGIDYESGSGGICRYNIFELNSDDGIDLDGRVDLVIENNTVANNGQDGIEIRLHNHTGTQLNYIIRHNEIYGNGEDGIQLMDIDSSTVTNRFFEISQNNIYGNSAAGIGCTSNANTNENFEAASIEEPVYVYNNTFASNSHGITGGDSMAVVNNIFMDHSNIAVKKVDGDSELAHNIFFNNGTDNSGANLISGTNLFVDPMINGDLELVAGSPAIDAGVNSYVWQGNTVFSYTPADYSGSARDIGAFEFDSGTGAPPNAPTLVAPADGSTDLGLTPTLTWSGTADVFNLEMANDGGFSNTVYSSIGSITSIDHTVPIGVLANSTLYFWRVSGSNANGTGPWSVTWTMTTEVAGAPPDAPILANPTDGAVDISLAPLLNWSGTADDYDVEVATDFGFTDVVFSLNGPATEVTVSAGALDHQIMYFWRVKGSNIFGTGQWSEIFSFTTFTQGPGGTQTIEVRVSDDDDDAEENNITGGISMNSSDLELAVENSPQIVGMRFSGMNIPNGANIINAYIQFQADEVRTQAASLTIFGEDIDSAPVFTAAINNISSRTPTSTSVGWIPAPWPTVGAAGTDQRTPNINSVIQEIVSRPGWSSGNDLVAMVAGTGKRTAESHNGDSAAAPLLHVEFSTGGGNLPPTVNIDAPIDEETFTEGESIQFTATATDSEDGNSAGSLTWSSSIDGGFGPGGESFSIDTLSVGTHTITANVTDSGGAPGSDSISITINSAGGNQTIDIRVSDDDNDAEESNSTGKVTRASSDLELVKESTNQTVGVRFTGLNIPNGANIVNAYIQFQVDEVTTQAASLTVVGEDIDNAPIFTSATNNISSRTPTSASVGWIPAPWPTVGEAGPDQRTPNIDSVIEEIVSRPGWSSGNDLVFMLTGTGKRTAESHNEDSTAAPLLHVEFLIGGGNLPPTVDIDEPVDGAMFTEGDNTMFTATATDPEDGNIAGNLAWISSIDGGFGPGGGSFSIDTLSAGTHMITANVTDSGGAPGNDSISITINSAGGTQTVEVQISDDDDDAEERISTAVVDIGSSDLELITEGSLQIVGVRFPGLNIPNSANIVNAYIQFQVDEITTNAASLTIAGEDIDSAPIFTLATGDISSRTPTTASVAWNPAPWPTVGEAGPDQRTPNIAEIIEEIVRRPGWSSGNALACLFRGTGKRTAESHNGDSAGAALLHVEYTTN